MDMTGRTHISDSYVPNSTAAPAPASGPGSAELDRTTPPHGLNVQECNIEVSRAVPSGSFAATAACLPSVPATSSSFNRIQSTGFLGPVSESERLLRSRNSQPSIVPNNSHIRMVNQVGSQDNSVSSSNSLPGFSQRTSQNFETFLLGCHRRINRLLGIFRSIRRCCTLLQAIQLKFSQMSLHRCSFHI